MLFALILCAAKKSLIICVFAVFKKEDPDQVRRLEGVRCGHDPEGETYAALNFGSHPATMAAARWSPSAFAWIRRALIRKDSAVL